jgi:hypothetical protein
MTVQDWLRQKYRRFLLVQIGCIVVFGLSTLLFQWIPDLLVIGVVSFGVGFANLLHAHYFLFRCPKCRGNFSPLVTSQASYFRGPSIRYCPHCGVAFEETTLD